MLPMATSLRSLLFALAPFTLAALAPASAAAARAQAPGASAGNSASPLEADSGSLDVAWDTRDLPVVWVALDEPPPAGALAAAPRLAVLDGLVLAGSSVTLELERHALRGPDFALLIQDAAGYRRVEPPNSRTYRGRVLEVPGSSVVATIDGGALTALIALPDTAGPTGGGRWVVQPLATVDPTVSPDGGAHLVYHVSQAPRLPADACGVLDEAFAALAPSLSGGSGTFAVGAGTGLRLAEIALDSDVQYFQQNGSSVANTVTAIENLMNAVDAIYASDVAVTFVITTIVVRTSEPDPYTTSNPSQLLLQVAQEWGQNLTGWSRDLVHMLTGRNLQGSTIGIANPSCVCQGCNSLAQSTQSSFAVRVALTAHEIGHQFGAGHCNGSPSGCFIMCSSLGGCGPIDKFSQNAMTAIANLLQSATCVQDLPLPIEVPVADSFDSGALDPELWLVDDDTEIDGQALWTPSGLALHLDATGPLAHQQDELWTNDLIFGPGPWYLSFLSEHRGVPVGGALVIDYRDASGDWVELERVVSDGVDQLGFVQNVFPLPGAATVGLGRLRLRTELSAPGQDFWVDAFAIDADPEPCEPPLGYCTGKLNSDGCVPSLGSAGAPSLAGATPFSIEAIGIVSQKPGLMVYGYAQGFVPFQDGILCALPPLRRTSVQQSGGAIGVPCEGVMTFDMGAWLASGIDPFLTLGQQVFCQFWYRDNLVPSQTGLTNGLRFTICD